MTRENDTKSVIRNQKKEDQMTVNTKKCIWIDSHPEIKESNLSTEAIDRLFEMSQQHIKHERPSWDIFFMNIAMEVAKRSPDSQTQIGAVVVNKENHIISVGYNGWMPGIDDSIIPNIRPGKHDWVIHAELNAILNCETRPRNCTLYVTRQPCINCFMYCVTSGISRIVHLDGSTTNTDGKDIEWEIARFLTRNKIVVDRVDMENPTR